MSDQQPIGRRHFFREGLRQLLDNVGKAAGPVQRAMKELEAITGTTTPPASPATDKKPVADERPASSRKPLRILRPPGAKPEDDFISTCSTCEACVQACPVQAIRLDDEADGVPYIIADQQPCVLCDGLLCMYSCPTGAITAVPIGMIDMGLADWRRDVCLRASGTDCTMCVDRCPIGPRAIELLDDKIVVHEEGCTGCGVCEHACPTTPRAIVVIPS